MYTYEHSNNNYEKEKKTHNIIIKVKYATMNTIEIITITTYLYTIERN